MSLPVFDLIAEFFYGIFGNGLIFTGVFIFLIIIIMMSLRASLGVILVVLIPLLLGIVVNTAGSNLLELPIWTYIVLWILLAFIFAVTFLYSLLR